MTTQTSRLPWRMVPTQSTTRQKSFFEQLVELGQNRLQEFFDDFEAHCEGESIDIENLVRKSGIHLGSHSGCSTG